MTRVTSRGAFEPLAALMTLEYPTGVTFTVRRVSIVAGSVVACLMLGPELRAASWSVG